MSVISNNPLPAASAQTEEMQAPASLPLYLSALLIIECGLLAVNLILNDIGFSNLTMGLAAIGVTVSYISRKQNVAPKSIEIPAMLLCIFLAFVAYFSDKLLPFLSPTDILDDRSKGLAVLLTWLLVFWSFALTLDGAILFCCVPIVAIFGLVGHMTTEPVLIIYFSVFIGSAAFMLVHENFLSRRRQSPRPRRAGGERILLFGQVQIALICGVGAMLAAKVLTPVLEGIGTQFQLTTGLIPQSAHNPDRTVTSAISFSEQKSIDVGGKSESHTDKVVMRVKAQVGANWRGATYNEYTGRTWRSTLSNSQRLVSEPQRTGVDDVLGDPAQAGVGPSYKVPVSALARTGAGSHRVVQEVQFQSGGLFSEIYAAPECRLVKIADVPLLADLDGSIHFPQAMANTRYIVESDVANTSPDVLGRSPEEYPDEIKANYIALQTPTQPEALEQIRHAAQQAIAGKKSPYDKVLALQDMVAQLGKYDTNAGQYPAGADVTAYFLFTGHQGDCRSFATALAVLCRSVGIPARVASGFLPGVFDQSTQEYFVRDKDKHLWTEVYFANVGWVPFDVTGLADVADAGDSDSAKVRKKGFLGLLFQRGILPPLALTLFVLMLGYVFKVEVLDRTRKRKKVAHKIGLPQTNVSIVEAYEFASKLLARRGMTRSPGDTPHEYMERLRLVPTHSPGGDLSDSFGRLTHLLIRYRYGKETAAESDVSSAQSAVVELRIILKQVKRIDAFPLNSALVKG